MYFTTCIVFTMNVHVCVHLYLWEGWTHTYTVALLSPSLISSFVLLHSVNPSLQQLISKDLSKLAKKLASVCFKSFSTANKHKKQLLATVATPINHAHCMPCASAHVYNCPDFTFLHVIYTTYISLCCFRSCNAALWFVLFVKNCNTCIVIKSTIFIWFVEDESSSQLTVF